MTKVTYLLGAGASAEVLPLARTIRDSYTGNEKPGLGRQMAMLAENIRNEVSTLASKEQSQAFTFIDNLVWLSKESETHGTVDTFAKKLFLQEQDDLLQKLKTTLSLFLIIEQNTKGFDKRYTSFFASILEKKDKSIAIPPNIKILTWNYDIQLEMAFQYYHRIDAKSDIKSAQTAMKSIPISNNPFINSEQANVVHLNGIGGLYNIEDSKSNDIFDRTGDSNNQKLAAVLNHTLFFVENMGRSLYLDRSFQFAWEIDQLKSDSTFSAAKKISSETDILVTIGYSFPFFNRSIDREIFKSFKTNLKKIYFQDPNLDGSFLRAQFDIGTNIEIEHIKETNQFFLPHEL